MPGQVDVHQALLQELKLCAYSLRSTRRTTRLRNLHFRKRSSSWTISLRAFALGSSERKRRWQGRSAMRRSTKSPELGLAEWGGLAELNHASAALPLRHGARFWGKMAHDKQAASQCQ